MKKLISLTILLFVCLSTFAQWIKPEAPSVCPIEMGNYCYIFNKEAGGFLYCDNELGTRAIIKKAQGTPIFIDIKMSENGWDGESYHITCNVDNNEMANQRGYMYVDSIGQLLFNKTKENDDNVFNLIECSDNIYKISLSAHNKVYNPVNYPNTFLGGNSTMKESHVYLCTLKNDIIDIDTTETVVPTDTTIIVVPTDTTETVVPTDTTINVIPTDTTINVLPTDTTETVVPTDTTINVLPTDTTINVIPTDTTINVLPTDTTINVLPTDTTIIVVPTDTTINVLPTDTTIIVVPTDTTINVLPTDTTINVLPTDTTINVVPTDTITIYSIKTIASLPKFITTADTTNYQLTWYFVSQKEYKKYNDALTLYYRAIELGKLIEEADQLEGIDEYILFNAKFFYDHTFTTLSDINYAYDELLSEIKRIKIANASKDKPFEVLSPTQDIEQTFENCNVSGWKMATNATNKKVVKEGAIKNFEETGYYLENSSDDAFGTGRIYSVAKDIPNGVYKLSMLAFTNVIGSTYVYAGTEKVMVNSTMIDSENPSELFIIVDNNELEFGLRIDNNGPSRVGLDNVNLYYLGNSEETFMYVADELISKYTDYETLISSNEIKYYNKNDYNNYLTIKGFIKNSTSQEEITARIEEYKKSIDELSESVNAYRRYAELCNNASQWINEVNDSNAYIDILVNYISADADSSGFNNKGNAPFILDKLALTTEEVWEELQYLCTIYNSAIATKLQDGDDCTVFINNAEMKTKDGWTSTADLIWPTGNVELFPVVEAKNMTFNIYQEFKNIKDGVYELTLQGVLRPGNKYTEDNAYANQVYAYLNSFESTVPCGDVNTAEQASNEFAEQKWNITIYGTVTNGTLKIGIANKHLLEENSILFAGGPKLTYHAKNAELLAKLIDDNIEEAKRIYNNSYCGIAEKEALNYSIKYANKEDDPFEEFINLRNNMSEVVLGDELYKKIANAIESLNSVIRNNTINDVLKSTLVDINSNAANLWNKGELSNTRAQKVLEQLYEAILIAKRSVMEESTPDNPAEYTGLIVNNDLDPNNGDKDITWIDGWNTTVMSGYEMNTVSYSYSAIELNQTLYGLMKGKYKIIVPGYYRAGYYNEEEERLNHNENTHLATLYVKTANNTYSIPLLNLNEGATDNKESEDCIQFSNNLYAPNSCIASVDYFDKGHYINELEFEITKEGPVTIGISKSENYANDYCIIGKWNLWNIETYHDVNTIDNANAEEYAPYAIYSVSGNRLTKPEKGINIIRKNDNSVVKMIVK